MRTIRILSIAGGLTLTLCAAAWAQRPVTLELTPVAGAQLHGFDLPALFALEGTDGRPVHFRNVEFEAGPVAGGQFGIRADRRWGIEGTLLYRPARLVPRSGDGQKQDVNIYTVGGNASVMLPRNGRITPFVVAGAGMKMYDFADAPVATWRDFMWSFGAGAAAPLNERIAVVVEARDYVSQFHSGMDGAKSAMQNDLVMTAGLRLSITRERRVVAVR
jgi:opacity protein-like surface antigen